MRVQWITAACLSTALLAGCNSNQTPPASDLPPADTSATTEPVPPAPEVSPSVDTVPPPAADTRTRPPAAPSRPSASSRPAPAPAPSPAPAARDDDRPAPAPAPAARAEYRTLRVPADTALSLELLTPLSSETTQVEAPVRARVKQAIAVDGFTVLPAGPVLQGSVTEVAAAGRVKGRSRVAFSFTEAVVAGAREKLTTNPIVFEGTPTKGKDAAKIGIGAGVGAVIGGIVGGGSGAAKGAAIGGAAGTGAVLATKGEEVTVAEGADIPATLADPFDLRVRVER